MDVSGGGAAHVLRWATRWRIGIMYMRQMATFTQRIVVLVLVFGAASALLLASHQWVSSSRSQTDGLRIMSAVASNGSLAAAAIIGRYVTLLDSVASATGQPGPGVACPSAALWETMPQLSIVWRDGSVACSTHGLVPPTASGRFAPQPATWHSYTGSKPKLFFADPAEDNGLKAHLVKAVGQTLWVIPIDSQSLNPAFRDGGTGAEVKLTSLSSAVGAQISNAPPSTAATGATPDPGSAKVISARARIDGTPWAVEAQVKRDLVRSQVDSDMQVVDFALISAFALLVAALMFVGKWVVQPIKKLRREALKAISNPGVKTVTAGPVEVAQLGYALNELITARDRAQNKLAHALVTLIHTRESEKQQLAVELHDTAVQTLTMAEWIIGDALDAAGDDDEPVDLTRADLARALSLIRTATGDLRRQSNELLPETLGRDGLAAAVADLAERTGSKTLHVEYDHALRADVPKEIEILAFRTIQEALRNVVKHAHAHNVWVHIDSGHGELCGIVRDDGVGFTEEHLERQRLAQHFGVVSMRETVTIAGGSFAFGSTEDGATLMFTVPLTGIPSTSHVTEFASSSRMDEQDPATDDVWGQSEKRDESAPEPRIRWHFRSRQPAGPTHSAETAVAELPEDNYAHA